MKKRVISLVLLFIMLCSTQVFAYTDVKDTDWYCTDVMTLSNGGVICGYSDGTFKPTRNVTYAEFLKMLFMVEGALVEPTKTGEVWYQGLYKTGVENFKIIPQGTDMNKAMTRTEVATTLTKMINGFVKVPKDYTVTYKDVHGGSSYETNLMTYLGIMKGIETPDGLCFYGDKTISRAEVCKVLVNYTEYLKKYYGVPEVEKIPCNCNKGDNCVCWYDEAYDIHYCNCNCIDETCNCPCPVCNAQK